MLSEVCVVRSSPGDDAKLLELGRELPRKVIIEVVRNSDSGDSVTDAEIKPATVTESFTDGKFDGTV